MALPQLTSLCLLQNFQDINFNSVLEQLRLNSELRESPVRAAQLRQSVSCTYEALRLLAVVSGKHTQGYAKLPIENACSYKVAVTLSDD